MDLKAICPLFATLFPAEMQQLVANDGRWNLDGKMVCLQAKFFYDMRYFQRLHIIASPRLLAAYSCWLLGFETVVDVALNSCIVVGNDDDKNLAPK